MKLTAIKEKFDNTPVSDRKVSINISGNKIDVHFYPEKIHLITNNFSLLEEIVKEFK